LGGWLQKLVVKSIQRRVGVRIYHPLILVKYILPGTEPTAPFQVDKKFKRTSL